MIISRLPGLSNIYVESCRLLGVSFPLVEKDGHGLEGGEGQLERHPDNI